MDCFPVKSVLVLTERFLMKHRMKNFLHKVLCHFSLNPFTVLTRAHFVDFSPWLSPYINNQSLENRWWHHSLVLKHVTCIFISPRKWGFRGIPRTVAPAACLVSGVLALTLACSSGLLLTFKAASGSECLIIECPARERHRSVASRRGAREWDVRDVPF